MSFRKIDLYEIGSQLRHFVHWWASSTSTSSSTGYSASVACRKTTSTSSSTTSSPTTTTTSSSTAHGTIGHRLVLLDQSIEFGRAEDAASLLFSAVLEPGLLLVKHIQQGNTTLLASFGIDDRDPSSVLKDVDDDVAAVAA